MHRYIKFYEKTKKKIFLPFLSLCFLLFNRDILYNTIIYNNYIFVLYDIIFKFSYISNMVKY